MTILVIFATISIGNNLAIGELIEIDRKITKNRKTTFFFIRDIKISVIILVGGSIYFNNVPQCEAVGLPLSPPPMVRINPNYQHMSKVKSRKIIANKKDRLIYKILSEKTYMPSYIYLMDDKFFHHPEIRSIVRDLRGGTWPTALIGNMLLIAVLYGMWVFVPVAESFVQPPNPGWGMNRDNSLYQLSGLSRPADCQTQLFTESISLKTEASRNQPHPKDRWILVESRRELVIRRGQAQFKTKGHGALAGLPYKIKNNGGTSTLITEENVDTFMDAVEAIVEDPNSIWFEDAKYQNGAVREVDSINIFNEEQNRIAIFKQSTNEFITFCELREEEEKHLFETGNFGGQFESVSGQAKNVPPKVEGEQNVVDEITPIDSFESHVMGITPLDPSSSDYQI